MDAPPETGRVNSVGRLREGYHKVAAVVRDEVYRAILEVMADKGLRSVHAATGAALEEWFADRRRKVQNRAESQAGDDLAGTPQGVQNRPDMRGEGA